MEVIICDTGLSTLSSIVSIHIKLLFLNKGLTVKAIINLEKEYTRKRMEIA